jgi:hypothetical protein
VYLLPHTQPASPVSRVLPRQVPVDQAGGLLSRRNESDEVARHAPTGFPAVTRLNRMGRRFSSHGHLISRASGSGKLSTVGEIPAACLTAPLPSASAFLPTLRRARALHRRPFIYLLHRTIISTVSAAACFTEPPNIGAASEDAPFPFGRSPQAALIVRFTERTVSAGGLSAPCFVSSLSTQFCSHCIENARSPQTALQLTASTSRARSMLA